MTLTCPWCDEDAAVEVVGVDGPGEAFTCPHCGTSVRFVEEPAEPLELAA